MGICAESVGATVKLLKMVGLVGLAIKIINPSLLPFYFSLPSAELSPLLDPSRLATDLDLLDPRLRLEDDRPLLFLKVTFGAFFRIDRGWLLDRPRFLLPLLAVLLSSSAACSSSEDFFFDG